MCVYLRCCYKITKRQICASDAADVGIFSQKKTASACVSNIVSPEALKNTFRSIHRTFGQNSEKASMNWYRLMQIWRFKKDKQRFGNFEIFADLWLMGTIFVGLSLVCIVDIHNWEESEWRSSFVPISALLIGASVNHRVPTRHFIVCRALLFCLLRSSVWWMTPPKNLWCALKQ